MQATYVGRHTLKLWVHGSERVHYTKEMNAYNYNVHKVLFGYIHEIDKEEKEGYSAEAPSRINHQR